MGNNYDDARVECRAPSGGRRHALRALGSRAVCRRGRRHRGARGADRTARASTCSSSRSGGGSSTSGAALVAKSLRPGDHGHWLSSGRGRIGRVRGVARPRTAHDPAAPRRHSPTDSRNAGLVRPARRQCSSRFSMTSFSCPTMSSTPRCGSCLFRDTSSPRARVRPRSPPRAAWLNSFWRPAELPAGSAAGTRPRTLFARALAQH